MTFGRILLARRRFDASLLALGFALLPLMSGGGKAVFAAFIAAGLYLACARHRVRRLAPVGFTAMLLAYVAWTIGLSLLRGEPIAGNRALSYALVEFGFLFLPLGLCLVPRPMDAMAIGARIAVLATAVLAPVQSFVFLERAGLGGNEAIFGFLAALSGVISRLPAAAPPRWLPNGRGYFYLSLLPVVLSQTRAAWLLYGLVLLIDLVVVLRGRRPAGRRSWSALGLGVAVLLLAAVPTATVVRDRFSVGLDEYWRFQETGTASGSVDVRLAMWQGGLRVLAEHPLLGVGGTARTKAVAEAAPGAARNGGLIRSYKHLHNVVLDEALTSGLVGLALLVGVFATFLASVWRWSTSPEIRETAALMLVLVALFGSFHGVLLNEWMIIHIFGSMMVLLTALGPWRRTRADGSDGPLQGLRDGTG